MHDEDESRDYDLEAQDDTASFDIGNDIEAWWSANRQIEMAGEDVAKRRQLFGQFGIRNMQHYYQVVETVRRFICGVRLENAMQAGRPAFDQVCQELSIETQEQVDWLRRTAWRYAPEQQQRAIVRAESSSASRVLDRFSGLCPNCAARAERSAASRKARAIAFALGFSCRVYTRTSETCAEIFCTANRPDWPRPTVTWCSRSCAFQE